MGLRLIRNEQSIEAATPTEKECAIFDFPAPVPCLLIKRRTYDEEGRMIDYVEGLFRGDTYAYRLRMKV